MRGPKYHCVKIPLYLRQNSASPRRYLLDRCPNIKEAMFKATHGVSKPIFQLILVFPKLT